MKIVIFAGGSGTRLWPISRKQFPKQFQPIIDNKSTIELRVEQLAPTFGWNNIYFSTTESLVSLIKNMFPKVPTTNIITEPTRRDLGPAVGLAMVKLQKLGAGDEPVAVLWGDSVTMKADNFLDVMKAGEELIRQDSNRLIWLGEKPTFPNDNVGWITLGEELGEKNGVKYYHPTDFKYKPELKLAEQWEKDGKHVWNTGYFVTTANFVMSKYEENYPVMAEQLKEIAAAIGTDNENDVLQRIYPKLEAVHFDHIVLDHVRGQEALVLEGAFGWDDPGTLYALKQFLQEKKEDNVCKGLVYTYDTKDSLVYNYVNKQVVTTIGLEGFVVVNTPDAILVVPKDRIKDISNMLEEMKGTELEKLL